MATMLPLLMFLVSLYLIIANGGHSFEEKKMFNLQMLQGKHQFGTMSTCLLPESRRERGAIIMEMKERGYCSKKKITWNRRLQKQLILDDLHVHAMQKKIRITLSGHSLEESSQVQIPLASGVHLDTLNYIVKMELGTQNMTVMVDTGSDVTWVQCEPCMSCYYQQGPIFKPSISSSYKSIPCNSSTCQSLQISRGSNTVSCGGENPLNCYYDVNYGDGSYTHGELGTEHLSLAGVSMNNFIFGCGRNNNGIFGGVSGVIGLSRSNLSLVYQSNNTFGRVFSYCLPTTEDGASGTFVMGNDSSVYKNLTPIAYTSMVQNPQLPTFYLINLTGINVGGVALHDPSFGSGGVIIDSGTVITRLTPSVYKAVTEEFLKQFSGYPAAPGYSILDTCFNLTGYQEIITPTIRMQFEDNVELNVDATGIMYVVKDDSSQVCLALASLDDEIDIPIIGNYQQRNHRVIYDTKQSKVGFAREQCSFT